MLEPLYDENIIVGVKYLDNINWYVAYKDLWYMDLKKLTSKEYENYMSISELANIRKNINIINKNNVKDFLNSIEEYKADINILRLKIFNALKENNDELEDFYPVLFIDFDEKIFYSQYPEPCDFESYIPDDWASKYYDFTEKLKDDDKYWLYNGVNILE